MTALSGGAPEQAPRWDLVDTESYGSGIRVLAPYLIVWGYVGIYRWKEYVGGASRGPRGRGRALGGGAPPTLVTASLIPCSRVQVSWITFGEKITSRRFYSVWTPFDILFLRNTKIGKKNSNSGLGLRLIG